MKLITKEQLLEGLKTLPKAAIITLAAEVDPSSNEMKKTGNPYYGKVKKRIIINCSLGADYEGAVNRQREREDKNSNFVVEPHLWADVISNNIVKNRKTGELAIRIIEIKKLHEEYLFDGKPIDKSLLIPFFKKKSPPKKQDLNKTIKYKNIYVNGKNGCQGILYIKYGDSYIVK